MSQPVQSGPCAHCKTDMWLPDELHSAARRSEKITFFCPYGHPQHFPQGDSQETILRRERDRLIQQLAQKDDEIKDARNRWNNAEKALAIANQRADEFFGKTVKARKRTKAGVCPCCSRTFRQMALHMANKHPTFKAEEVK